MCCKDCENRSIYCHSTCEIYKKYAEERQKIREARQQYLDLFAPITTAPKGKSRTLKKIKMSPARGRKD